MKSAHGVRRLACALVSMVAIGFTGCVSCTTPSFPSIGSSACSPCGCGGGGMLKGLLNRGGGCGCGGGLRAAVSAVTPCGGDCGGGCDPCNSGGLLQNVCGNGCGMSGGLLGGGGACAQEMAGKFGSMCEGGMCNRPYPPGMGPGGMPGAMVQYPYYTLRSPRDFLMANPPSIGP